MNENFRCDESVIDFANIISSFMFMTSLAPEEDEKFCMSQSIAYEEKDNLGFAKRDAGNPPDDVEVLIIDRDDDGDGDDDNSGDDDSSGGGDDEAKDLKNHYIEAENIANKISELLANKYLANGQKITADKIAILLRSFRAPAEFYINALRRRGIPCEYKGDEHFFEKGEVLLALDVLHAIDNPLRDTYLAGAMLSGVFGEQTPVSLEEKKEFLLSHAIALYDVISSCEIEGSSDSSIKNATPNDIRSIVEGAQIEKIITNGKLAHKLYERHIASTVALPEVCLPSTSPANAAFSLDRLISEWRAELT
jgi:hypoxanthine-DNA glycosylase